MLLKALICHRKTVWLFCSANHIHGLCCLTQKPHCFVYVKCEGKNSCQNILLYFIAHGKLPRLGSIGPLEEPCSMGPSVYCFASAITQICEKRKKRPHTSRGVSSDQEPLSSIMERARWHSSCLMPRHHCLLDFHLGFFE